VTTSDSLSVLFSPHGLVEAHIVSLIKTAQVRISMAAYAFTNQNIANAILDRLGKGVYVLMVMDKSQTHGQQAKIHDQLTTAGAHVYLVSPPGGIMHDKFIVVDGTWVEWGSYNYTDRAENNNFENATSIQDTMFANKYDAECHSIAGQGTPEVLGLRRPIHRFLRRLRFKL